MTTIILIYAGLAFVVLGAVGLVRFPDFFCRAHALTKSMTLGISLILIAVLTNLGLEHASVKVLVAIVFQFTTIPLSGHILGNVALEKNIDRYKKRKIQTLKNKTAA